MDDLDVRLDWLADDARIYREMLHASLDNHREALQRQDGLERQIQALREEIRRYVAAQVTE